MYTRDEVPNGKDVERRGRVGVEQKCAVNDDHDIRVKQLVLGAMGIGSKMVTLPICEVLECLP